ncbi:MAG: YihY/virulence factor BrkB family protein [Deltaproteobacteria bacterium]|nr:YihY/virulence factor BrkB family protein [Deltaproteobacteria bacterium]MDL1962249.1 YihY/virulence factor BrkB family protein [Deltaproteobacteria bacterium]
MNNKENIDSPETQQRSGGLSCRLRRACGSLVAWVWSTPEPDEQQWLKLIRLVVRIHLIVFQEFQRDVITLRASALTFTVVLSLVPMLALGTAVLKGLGAGDQMREAAYKFIDQLELSVNPVKESEEQITSAAGPVPASQTDADRVTAAEPVLKGLTVHLRKAVDQIFDYVDRTNFATLGAFGILGLVIAAIFVLGSIEQAMNVIWQAESSRPIGRKIMDYLALMILLPISLNTVMATMATLQSKALLVRLEGILPATWLGPLLLNMVPIVLLVATFTILYRFLPNTKVNISSALVGGVCGGIGWLLIQVIYIKLQIGVARYNAIYGSFATLPLFLVWMQMGWVVFLAGAEMAFAFQVWRSYVWKGTMLNPSTRLALAFDIMEATLADFHERRVTDRTSLARRLSQSDAYIASVLESLLSKGLLRGIDGEKDRFVPAAPAEEINPAEIVDLIYGTEVPSSPGGHMAEEGLKAAKSVLAEKKMTHLEQ